MDRFSFVMVLLSIIVGLGVTELLTNLARQIQNRATIKHYWIHTLLSLMVFLALLQQWWESWDQRFVESWSFPILLLMLGGPIGLYITSHLLFPKDLEGADLKALYYRSHRVLYGIGVVTVAFATIYRPLSFGDGLIDADNASSVLIALAFLTLAISKKPVVHHTIVPVLCGAVVFDILFFHMSI